jgi:hypothetical protein
MFVMNSPGRTCVHSSPDSSTARSTRAWWSVSKPSVTAAADNTTMRRTPACFARSTTSAAVSGCGNRKTFATPSNAVRTDAGSSRSPWTTSTPCGRPAFAGLRVSARTDVPARTS